jgi:predicted nucleic acid-binding protein
MTYLLDSGFLYALVNTGDSRHQDVIQIADGHRDFRVIGPRHCQAFELLPSA